MLKHCGNYAAIMTNYVSFLHQKCFSDSTKDVYCRSQNMNNQNIGKLHTICFLQTLALVPSVNSCRAYFKSISVLSGPT